MLFCQRFHCPLSEYEDRAFRKCLYWHARMLAPVVRRLKPDFFAEDLKFKDFVAGASPDDAAALRPQFIDDVADTFRALAPFMRFLCTALDLPF